MPAQPRVPQSLRRRGRASRGLAAIARVALAVAGLAAASCGFAGPGGRTAPAGRQGAAVARSAAERAAYIAVVEVNVTPGEEKAFLGASLENARESVKEDKNCRFDILQSQDNPSHFTLVEIYDSAEGPVGHKGTDHYLSWRDAVAGLMASPRQASQWDTVFPSDPSGYRPNVILLERQDSIYLDITHVFSDVKPGREDEFIKATVRCIKDSFKFDAGQLRFDLLRSADDPSKFLMVQVFRQPTDTDGHRRSDHYARWRDTVADMMAEPRQFKKYVNHFPNLPGGWKADEGMQ